MGKFINCLFIYPGRDPQAITYRTPEQIEINAND